MNSILITLSQAYTTVESRETGKRPSLFDVGKGMYRKQAESAGSLCLQMRAISNRRWYPYVYDNSGWTGAFAVLCVRAYGAASWPTRRR